MDEKVDRMTLRENSSRAGGTTFMTEVSTGKVKKGELEVYLNNERFSIAEHKREKWTYSSCLTSTHNHLFDQ